MLKVAIISDTHMYHEKVAVPECDILIHCGDYSHTGTFTEVSKFMYWFMWQPAKHLVLINGNHEKEFWKDPNFFQPLIPENVHYLEDEFVVIEGLKIYGSPHTPEFFGWAYPTFSEEQAEQIWKRVPDDVDILVTHGPPYRVLDFSDYKADQRDDQNVGCKALRRRVEALKPMIHCFGHIHNSYGSLAMNGTRFINAATCDGAYNPFHRAVIVDIDEKEKKVLSVDFGNTSDLILTAR